MKPLFLIITFLIAIVSSKNSSAQTSSNVKFNLPSLINPKILSTDKKNSKPRFTNVKMSVLDNFARSSKILSETKVTKVNINAARHFLRAYKNIPDAQWFQTEGGSIANFHSKGIDTKIVYDDKGRWFYNLLSYTEANLTFEIRDLVMSKYYDNDILVVHEYQFKNDKTVYIIRMGSQQFKIVTLKVCDGEIADITNCDEN